MSFDLAAFERAKFAPRTKDVPVPDLAAFFPEGAPAVFTVRNLTANEFVRAADAAKRQSNIESVVKAIATGGDQASAIRQLIGLTTDTPGEVAKRLEMLVMGCVAPKLELSLAVKLAENFPIEFLALSSEIIELTGKGADLVKPEAASQPTMA